VIQDRGRRFNLPRVGATQQSHVECNDEGVEIGVHEASQEVDVASATPILGALVSVVTARHPQADSEAII
jgi:hypothetical protein